MDPDARRHFRMRRAGGRLAAHAEADRGQGRAFGDALRAAVLGDQEKILDLLLEN